jgi:dienelactone hydrolase
MRRNAGLAVCALALTAALAGAQATVGLRERARGLVEALAAGRGAAAAADFDARMAAALTPDRLAGVWGQIVGQVGEFRGIEGVRTTDEQGYHVVYVTAAFAQARLDAKVVFDSASKVAGLFFLPAAAPSSETVAPTVARAPEGVRERPVEVGPAPWKLPGTLSLPAGHGRFPAVVLVHGSGPQDQDETIGPNKPFRDLAWGLAARGVAVLRYAKRTEVYAASIAQALAGFTVNEETVIDARAAVAALAAQPEVDPRRIFVLGHSLGGMLAPRIAAGDPQVAGLVIMAGNTRPFEKLIVEQLTTLAGRDGQVSEAECSQIDQAKEEARRIEDPKLKPGDVVTVLGAATPGSYWLDLRGYRPAEVAAGLEVPMLILQGGRDYQVREADLDGWRTALAGRPNVTIKVYPALNHLFIAGEGPSSPAEYAVAGHVDPTVVRDIAAFILQPGRGR